MKAAAPPVKKESHTQQAEHKKKQQQIEPLSLPLRETENANGQTQKPDGETIKNGLPNEGRNRLSNHNGIPAVHGRSLPIYRQGAEIMHEKLQASLAQTGDLNHPDTKKVEMDYKRTLGISELRDYHDIKSGTYFAKTPAEQVAMAEVAKSNPETSVTAKAPDTKEIAKKAESASAAQQPKQMQEMYQLTKKQNPQIGIDYLWVY
jgi:hypothetical protein